MPDHFDTDEVVYQSALQLWAAAQTDFDPYEVPPRQWGPDAVAIRDADIAVDAKLDLDEVRASLRRLHGERLVIDHDGGTLSVRAPISKGGLP